MLINIEQLKRFHEEGVLRPRVGWGDAKETACLMSALTGRTNFEGCAAKGWPDWLAQLGVVIFDNAGDEWWPRSIAFAEAVKTAEERGADFDRVFRDIRLAAVLPIAMESIGEGDEPWRVACREVVQWSIDNDGKAAEAAGAEKAAKAAWVVRSKKAAWVAKAAQAARAAWAAEASQAAGAAWSSGADAHTRIFDATISALRG
jgi:hypothetical protein